MAGFNSEALTANEAASVTRVPLKQVHRIIDAGLLRGRVETRRGSRVIIGSGLVGLRLAWLTAESLTPTARRGIVERAIATDAASVVAADPLKVDLKPIAAEVKTGLARLRKAKAMVSHDADVLRGQPIFVGTRVSVHDIADMLTNGDTPEAIHSAFPQLTLDQIGLAADYVVAYPRRGRPPIKPVWRTAAAKSSRAVALDDLPATS